MPPACDTVEHGGSWSVNQFTAIDFPAIRAGRGPWQGAGRVNRSWEKLFAKSPAGDSIEMGVIGRLTNSP
jgi:hypothetical protein